MAAAVSLQNDSWIDVQSVNYVFRVILRNGYTSQSHATGLQSFSQAQSVPGSLKMSSNEIKPETLQPKSQTR